MTETVSPYGEPLDRKTLVAFKEDLVAFRDNGLKEHRDGVDEVIKLIEQEYL